MHIARRFGRHARGPVGQLGRVQHGGFHLRHFGVLGVLCRVLCFVVVCMVRVVVAVFMSCAVQCAALVTVLACLVRILTVGLLMQYGLGRLVVRRGLAGGCRGGAADGLNRGGFVGCQGVGGVGHITYLLVARGLGFSRPS